MTQNWVAVASAAAALFWVFVRRGAPLSAAAMGDCLVVALLDDAAVRARLGGGHPVVSADDRAEHRALLLGRRLHRLEVLRVALGDGDRGPRPSNLNGQFPHK